MDSSARHSSERISSVADRLGTLILRQTRRELGFATVGYSISTHVQTQGAQCSAKLRFGIWKGTTLHLIEILNHGS